MTDLEIGLEGIRLGLSAAALVGAGGALSSSIMADWRQELYEVRNELWDAMRREGQLQHPEYLELRDGINGLIRLAPAVGLLHAAANLGVAWWATRGRMESELPSVEVPPLSPAAAAAIERASQRVARALTRRILFDTFPGCLIGWPCWAIWSASRRVRPAAWSFCRGVSARWREWSDEMANHIGHQAAAAERRKKAVTV